MRVEYKDINNSVLRKIHRAIKQLKDAADPNFQARFTYGDHESSYTFKVKFYRQKKALIFTVPKDPAVETFQITYLEKTKNVIEDIDQIYKEERPPKFMDVNNITPAALKSAFNWVISPSDRDGEIFKAPITAYPMSGALDDNTLYYRVVKSATVIQEVTKTDPELKTQFAVRVVEVEFGDGRRDLIEVQAGSMMPTRDNLMILNSKGKYALMSYSTARRHIDFDSGSHYDIVSQMNNRY